MKKILTTWTLLLLAIVAFAQNPSGKKTNHGDKSEDLRVPPIINTAVNVPLEQYSNEDDKNYRQGYNQVENRRNNEKQIIVSYLPYLLIAGFILALIITSNIPSTPKKQKVKEMELPDIKKTHDNSSPKPLEEKPITETVNDDMIGKIERLGKLKEQGLISEEEFQTLKQKLLQ